MWYYKIPQGEKYARSADFKKWPVINIVFDIVIRNFMFIVTYHK